MHSSPHLRTFGRGLFTLLFGLSLTLYSVPLVFAVSTYNVVQAAGTVGTQTTLNAEYTVDTAVQTWANADTLVVNLPPNIGPMGWSALTIFVEFDEDATDNGGGAEVQLSNGAGNGQWQTAGPNLTVKWDETTWTAETGDTIRINIQNVTPQYANAATNFIWSGTTAAAGDTNPSGTDAINISAGDPNASVTLGTNSVANMVGTTTVTFTTLVNLDQGDTVEFTFPFAFSVVAPVFVSETFAGAGTFSGCAAGGGTTVICTVGGDITSGTGNLLIDGLTALTTGTADITSFEIEDEGIAANDIGIDTTVALTDVTANSTYGTNTSTATVGTTVTNLKVAYTLSTTQQTWANGDTLTLNLPPNIDQWGALTYAVEFDEDAADNGGVGAEVALSSGGANGQYSVAGPVLTIKWDHTTWATDTGDTVRIVISNANLLFANASTGFTWGGATAAGGDTNPSGVSVVNVSAGNPNASVVLDTNAVVGATGTATVTFTTLLNLDADDTVKLTFPNYLNVSAASFASKTFAGAGTFSACTPGGQAVVCTANGAINSGTGNIVLNGIVGANVGTANITSFEIEDEGVGANDIGLDTDVALTDVTAADAAASVVLAGNSVVGTAGNTTVTLTLPTALDASDTVDITFPANFNVASAAFTSETFLGSVTFGSCVAAGQVVTCTVTGEGSMTAGTGDIVLAGILSTAAGVTDVTSVEVENEGVAADDIATDTSVSLTDVTAPAVSSGGSGTAFVNGSSTSSSGGDDDDDDDDDSGDSSSEGSEGDSGENSGTVEHPFTDIDSNVDYYDDIVDLYERGIIGGHPDGTLRDKDGMNRAELMKIIVLAVATEPDPSVYNNCYTDVLDEWFAPYVCYASEQGWVTGYLDGSFKPGETANNVEVLKMILNVNGVEVPEPEEGSNWYAPYVDMADSLGLIQEEYFVLGDGTLRGYAFHLLSKLLGIL